MCFLGQCRSVVGPGEVLCDVYTTEYTHLSLKGRTLLTKAEGISRLSYAANSLFVDRPTCKLIDVMLLKFLWKNKTHYIRKSVILNTYHKVA